MAKPIISLRGFEGDIPLNQIQRYLGMGGVDLDGELLHVVNECRPLLMNAIDAKACYVEMPVSIKENVVDIGAFKVESLNLSKILRGCDRVILIAATLGPHVDMLIRRENVKSKARGMVINAIAITAIESYMGCINKKLKEEYEGENLRPRYSPGYGDVPLNVQKDLLNVLDTNRKIGVSLTESLLMLPEKSVSAFIGIAKDGCMHLDKDCDICSKRDCEYRLS